MAGCVSGVAGVDGLAVLGVLAVSPMFLLAVGGGL